MIQEIRFYLSLFLRRIHYFILATLVGGAIGVTLAMILPPTYYARARLVVESEQIPDSLAVSTVHTQAVEQLQIIQQRILSREKLLDMANRLNIYGNQQRTPGAALRPDEIVEDLRERIQMSFEGNSGRNRNNSQATLVQVGFSAQTAQLASAVTNEIVTLILDENVRMRTGVSGQTLQFFEQEVNRLDKDLADRRAKIVAFQEQNKNAMPDSLEFRRTQFSTAQSRVLQLEAEEQTLVSRRDSIKALYEATGQVAGTETEMTPEARELEKLRERHASWTGGIEVDNPRIRVLRDRIAALEKVVADQEAERAAAEAGGEGDEATRPASPVDVQIADIENQLRLIKSERVRLDKEIENLRISIEATPANAVALEALQRDYDGVRARYDSAVAKRASAETGDLIEALSKGERISVIEQAVPPAEPTSPNRPKLVAAGVGGGMLAGLGLIALLELLNNAIRRPVDIVNKLDIVPLATLSYIRTAAEIRRRRVMIGTAFALILIGIPAALWVVNEQVMPLDMLWDKAIDKLPFKLATASLLPAEAAGPLLPAA